MPEAIFPFVIYPAEGQLPFINTARLMRGDELIATGVPISVWPTTGLNADVGMSYDHQAEAPLSFSGILRIPNARLYVDDVRYTVISLEQNIFMAHVALQLREMRSML